MPYQNIKKRYQTDYFADERIEHDWLDYNADFRAQSNYMGHVASPWGDPEENDKSQNRFSIKRGKANLGLHDCWRDIRSKSAGFSDPLHPFRHQGSADLNLYKLFLELAHALLRKGGRLGFIVPSGLYSDHGMGALRELFLDRCRWEWLFGFENRDKVFQIDSRFKFNPVIIEKGGKTEAIQTAFMRRKLEDWEQGETMLELSLCSHLFSREWISNSHHIVDASWRRLWAVTQSRRIEQLALFDAFAACWY